MSWLKDTYRAIKCVRYPRDNTLFSNEAVGEGKISSYEDIAKGNSTPFKKQMGNLFFKLEQAQFRGDFGKDGKNIKTHLSAGWGVQSACKEVQLFIKNKEEIAGKLQQFHGSTPEDITQWLSDNEATINTLLENLKAIPGKRTWGAKMTDDYLDALIAFLIVASLAATVITLAGGISIFGGIFTSLVAPCAIAGTVGAGLSLCYTFFHSEERLIKAAINEDLQLSVKISSTKTL